MTDNQAVGGASRDRTDDPLLAKQVLSQLSYGPLTCLRRRLLRCLAHSLVMYLMYMPASLAKRLALNAESGVNQCLT